MAKSELITKVEATSKNELLLKLKSDGNPTYQHIYREAAGVYWDSVQKGFRSTSMEKWTCEQWFKHIVSVVKSGLNVELKLFENTTWHGVPEEEVERLRVSAKIS